MNSNYPAQSPEFGHEDEQSKVPYRGGRGFAWVRRRAGQSIEAHVATAFGVPVPGGVAGVTTF